jgi:hypothetical protein
LIQLSEITLIAGAIGVGNGALGLFLLHPTCIKFHPLGDETVSHKCLRARFLHFLLDKEVESIGLFIDKLLFQISDTVLQPLLGLFVFINLLQEEVTLRGEASLI